MPLIYTYLKLFYDALLIQVNEQEHLICPRELCFCLTDLVEQLIESPDGSG